MLERTGHRAGMMKLIILLLLIGLSSAGDWDHLANSPQYAPSTWGIMTTAMHTCSGLSEYNLNGDPFILGVTGISQ